MSRQEEVRDDEGLPLSEADRDRLYGQLLARLHSKSGRLIAAALARDAAALVRVVKLQAAALDVWKSGKATKPAGRVQL